jgi:metal-responsive CopG/Arc/MetJ family transcriptional regulator
MKAIQITFDELLLEELDADPEVRRDGRSLVLRRAAFEYLRRKRRNAIAQAYRRAYGSKAASELAGWGGEGSWPEP